MTTTNAIALPEPVIRRGIAESAWRTLTMALYPGAKKESVLLAWDYCKSRRLDPLKRPVHILAIEIKVGNTYEWRDTIVPGITELRITAQRTGEYRGFDGPAVYGPDEPFAGVVAPAWCDVTVLRGAPGVPPYDRFPVRVYFREVVATKAGGAANARWTRAPRQMLEKCAEAAALRRAFPDEIGSDHAFEELDGQRAIDAAPAVDVPTLPKPAAFDLWLDGLQAAADGGDGVLSAYWQASKPEHRAYLIAIDPDGYDALVARAHAVGVVPPEPDDEPGDVA